MSSIQVGVTRPFWGQKDCIYIKIVEMCSFLLLKRLVQAIEISEFQRLL